MNGTSDPAIDGKLVSGDVGLCQYARERLDRRVCVDKVVHLQPDRSQRRSSLIVTSSLGERSSDLAIECAFRSS